MNYGRKYINILGKCVLINKLAYSILHVTFLLLDREKVKIAIKMPEYVFISPLPDTHVNYITKLLGWNKIPSCQGIGAHSDLGHQDNPH